jgi:chromosome segregation ATPase
LSRVCKSPSKSSSSFEGDETFTEIVHSITDDADEIAIDADERALRRIQNANEMLHFLKNQTRIRRRRMNDLENQIEILRSRIERRRSKTESALVIIDRQLSTLAASDEASQLHRDLAIDRIEREESEFDGVLRLRERLRRGHERLALVKQRGQQRQDESQESLENAIDRKSRYEASLDALEVDNIAADVISEALDDARQSAERLREGIARRNPELADLREENIHLFRRVNARKYEIKSLAVPRVGSPPRPSFLDFDA